MTCREGRAKAVDVAVAGVLSFKVEGPHPVRQFAITAVARRAPCPVHLRFLRRFTPPPFPPSV